MQGLAPAGGLGFERNGRTPWGGGGASVSVGRDKISRVKAECAGFKSGAR